MNKKPKVTKEGIVIIVVFLIVAGGLLGYTIYHNRQKDNKAEDYYEQKNKESTEQANALEPLVYEYEKLENQLNTLSPNTAEYIGTESELNIVIQEIIEVRPSFLKGFDDKNNPIYESSKELKQWVESQKGV